MTNLDAARALVKTFTDEQLSAMSDFLFSSEQPEMSSQEAALLNAVIDEQRARQALIGCRRY